MFLAIDVGNTHTVLGVFDASKLVASWRVTSSQPRTEDEIGAQVKLFLSDSRVGVGDVTGVGISSVVPNLTDIFAVMSKKYLGVEPLLVGSELNLGINIRYEDPSSVGADRLCNAIAGFAKHRGPLIIIDFGTATTYDVVAGNGDYLGGVIAPGIETSAADLHRRAAKLPKIELHFPGKIVGTNTVNSMQAGILYGALDSMEGMVRRIQDELRRAGENKAKVIATGGFSELMSKKSTMIEAWEPTLVLEGIRIIYEQAGKKGNR